MARAGASERGVRIAGRVVLTFADARTCRAVAAALAVDNPGSGVRQAVRGRTLVITAPPSSVRSMRETMDDLVRCAAAAEAAAGEGRGARS